jgi:hypothetical protein
MSMAMYRPMQDEAQGLPMPPGGQGAPLPPPDMLNAAGPVPGDEGIGGLMAALGGGGGGGPTPPEGMAPEGMPPEGMGGEAPPEEGPPPDEDGEMDPVEHIQQAMKHLMMALAKEGDEERGHGLVKGMSALQGLLAGDQKQNAQLSQLGG